MLGGEPAVLVHGTTPPPVSDLASSPSPGSRQGPRSPSAFVFFLLLLPRDCRIRLDSRAHGLFLFSPRRATAAAPICAPRGTSRSRWPRPTRFAESGGSGQRGFGTTRCSLMARRRFRRLRQAWSEFFFRSRRSLDSMPVRSSPDRDRFSPTISFPGVALRPVLEKRGRSGGPPPFYSSRRSWRREF